MEQHTQATPYGHYFQKHEDRAGHAVWMCASCGLLQIVRHA